MPTDSDDTDEENSLTDRLRDRAADARRARERKKAKRQLRRKRRRKAASERGESIQQAASDAKGAAAATRTGSALLKTTGAVRSLAGTVADAAAPPDDDGGGDDGGGDDGRGLAESFVDAFAPAGGGDNTDVFSTDEAVFRDVDDDDEREALFGDFGSSADLSVFDVDGDGDPDVIHADQPDAEVSIDTARLDVGRVVGGERLVEGNDTAGEEVGFNERLEVLIGGRDSDEDNGRPPLF